MVSVHRFVVVACGTPVFVVQHFFLSTLWTSSKMPVLKYPRIVALENSMLRRIRE